MDEVEEEFETLGVRVDILFEAELVLANGRPTSIGVDVLRLMCLLLLLLVLEVAEAVLLEAVLVVV